MKFFVGTSGFQYKHWNNGVFYPPGTKDQLSYIYERVNCVEINSSHYSIPKPEIVKRWADHVPDNSKLILKCPRSISHRRRLHLESDNPDIKPGLDYLEYFIEGCCQIPAHKRGPVLLQINDRHRLDTVHLEPVLNAFKYYGLRCAFEARHESWFCNETFKLLERYNSALVSHDWSKYKCPLVITADFTYLRNHGPKQHYMSSYSDDELQAKLQLIKSNRVAEAYVIFNNDENGYAPKNAIRLLELINSPHRTTDSYLKVA